MKKLLNTLFVTTADAYLSLKGENVVILKNEERIGRIPLHNIEAIFTFGWTGASPALMTACADKGISLVFLSRSGRFQARVVGETRGNVILRRTQYRRADDENSSVQIARNFILGKIYNSRSILKRTMRDYPLRVDGNKLTFVVANLSDLLNVVRCASDLEKLRGYEGQAAACYFSVFNECILQQNDDFYFHERNRRPPLDRINAMLSFAYTLLANDTVAACEAVGLDPYVGFMHSDRPGRVSLALDLMEELRSICADRFVLSLVNKRIIQKSDFVIKESGAVLLTDDGRRTFLSQWQERKQDSLTHPYLNEKIQWGLVPYVQALLLARYLRGDLDDYPPFFWR